MLKIIRHIVAAEWQHREGVISMPTLSRIAAVGSEAAVAPIKTPWSQSNASVTNGTTPERRPPKIKISIGSPSGVSQSGEIIGHCDAGVVKRELAWAAGSFLTASSHCLSSQSCEWVTLPFLPTRYPHRQSKHN